jgi:hypothetical protein
MTSKTKIFAHNPGKGKTSKKLNNNNKEDDNYDNNITDINNNSYDDNDNNEENNNNKNTKIKDKSPMWESVGPSTKATTMSIIIIPTKATNKEKNQPSNKNNTPKDKAKEKNQKTTLNTKIPDSQSPTTEASDFSSMLKRREEWEEMWEGIREG